MEAQAQAKTKISARIARMCSVRAITFWTHPQCAGTSSHQPIHVDKKKTSSSSALQGWWANCPNRYASPFQSSNHQSHGPRSQGLRAHASIQHHDKSCLSRRTTPSITKRQLHGVQSCRAMHAHRAARPATRAAPPPPRSANAASQACSTKGAQRLPRATCPPPAGPMMSSEFSAQPGP